MANARIVATLGELDIVEGNTQLAKLVTPPAGDLTRIQNRAGVLLTAVC